MPDDLTMLTALVLLVTLAALCVAAVLARRRALRRRARVLAAVARAAEEHERILVGASHRSGRASATNSLLADLALALRRPGPSRDEAVQWLTERAEGGARELAGLLGSLRPPVVEERGLEPGVRDLATWFGDVHGLACEPTVQVDGDLDARLETAVYRVAESLLTAAAQGGTDWARMAVTGGPRRVVVELVAGPEGAAGDGLTVTLEPTAPADTERVEG